MTHLAPYRSERDGIGLSEAQGMQDAGTIRADLDSRANFAQEACSERTSVLPE